MYRLRTEVKPTYLIIASLSTISTAWGTAFLFFLFVMFLRLLRFFIFLRLAWRSFTSLWQQMNTALDAFIFIGWYVISFWLVSSMFRFAWSSVMVREIFSVVCAVSSLLWLGRLPGWQLTIITGVLLKERTCLLEI